MLGQIGMGQWRLHVPNRTAMDVVANGNIVYAAFENGLLEFDNSAGEQFIWTDVNSLSDIRLTCLGRYAGQNAIYIGYENGNIDKIVNNQVVNIPAIKLAQIPGNKRINRIIEHQDFMYFATSFSIVKVDAIKDEVKETFYPTADNSPILDVAILGDTIMALTATKVLKANLSNIALADPNEWVIDSRFDVLTANAYQDLEVIQNNVYCLFRGDGYGRDSVFQMNYTGKTVVSDLNWDLEINSIANSDGKLVVNANGTIYTYNANNSLAYSFNSYNLGRWMEPLNSFYSNGLTWVADNAFGLMRINNEFSITQIPFSGPPKNSFYGLDWQDGKLAVAGGGLSSIASTFNVSGMYTFEDEQWSLFDKDNMSPWNNERIWDFLAVSIDPSNSDRIAVGTYSKIPVSILENGVQVTDTCTPYNSALEFTPVGIWSLVSGLQYDDQSNLWALNGFSSNPLKARSSDGVWHTFNLGSIASNKFTRRIVIDYNGHKWFGVDGVGLFGYNDNGTLSDQSDDKKVILNTGDYSGALPSSSITALAVDFDNEIWIGTDDGFAVLYNSESAFDAGPGEYNAQRIKLEFEGNVEYVLGNTSITDIEVDGANRKWFGTASSGIVLLSEDGLEIIQQFTKENSPLISNTIIDMELDQNTGELFIVTDQGLVSYRTDATYEDTDYENVVVFPNPARPDFEGPISIQGIKYDSDIKITDVAGNLVYKTTSNGGTATWNGKTLTGERVKTGVYLIWTAPNEGKGRKVGKVLVVN